jgi:hypothetical protein
LAVVRETAARDGALTATAAGSSAGRAAPVVGDEGSVEGLAASPAGLCVPSEGPTTPLAAADTLRGAASSGLRLAPPSAAPCVLAPLGPALARVAPGPSDGTPRLWAAVAVKPWRLATNASPLARCAKESEMDACSLGLAAPFGLAPARLVAPVTAPRLGVVRSGGGGKSEGQAGLGMAARANAQAAAREPRWPLPTVGRADPCCGWLLMLMLSSAWPLPVADRTLLRGDACGSREPAPYIDRRDCDTKSWAGQTGESGGAGIRPRVSAGTNVAPPCGRGRAGG